jgi:hypothetical protein
LDFKTAIEVSGRLWCLKELRRVPDASLLMMPVTMRDAEELESEEEAPLLL